MLNHTTYITSHANPLQYMMSKSYQDSQTSKWLIDFLEFDLDFISQKYIKCQFITYQLAKALLVDNSSLHINLLDNDIFKINEEYKFVDTHKDFDMNMQFNGSKCEKGGGTRVIFFTPEGFSIPYYFNLAFPFTNNKAKYEALILSLKEFHQAQYRETYDLW